MIQHEFEVFEVWHMRLLLAKIVISKYQSLHGIKRNGESIIQLMIGISKSLHYSSFGVSVGAKRNIFGGTLYQIIIFVLRSGTNQKLIHHFDPQNWRLH